MRRLLFTLCAVVLGSLSSLSANAAGVVFEGTEGPGKGKTIVLVSGDEEYRSEEALTQLGKILAEQHGFTCKVLYAIDRESGIINPNDLQNIPGLEALADADLMILFTRYRNLPDEQMQHIDNYLKAGKPLIGIRTATHGFKVPRNGKWAHYSIGYNGPKKEWKDGFGRVVMGETWIAHHGHHRHESTRGLIVDGQEQHPILRGLDDGDIWGPSDVYRVRLPLPGDSQPLVLGQVVKRDGEYDAKDPLFGMRSTDSEPVAKKNDPMMPIAWLKSYELPGGEQGTCFSSTIGASTDLLNEGVRKMFVNASYFLTGLEEKIPAGGAKAEIVEPFKPTPYQTFRGNEWNERGLKPETFANPS